MRSSVLTGRPGTAAVASTCRMSNDMW